jgi:hypothetical protein
MIEAPLALAVAAGLVATVKLCGFAMLPAYLSDSMGLSDESDGGRLGAVRTALTVGAAGSADDGRQRSGLEPGAGRADRIRSDRPGPLRSPPPEC